ncbi:MAG: UDP-N-acetylmuramate--L-alanine ligase [Anaerolineae bacterium]|nr:UDP-N-acetylmuramate--L-alanine ligase [Anaerolineae bacterium]
MDMDFKGKHVHLVGIGGAGLSAIARVLMGRGAVVSGSDLFLSPVAADLERDGVRVYMGHEAAHVDGAEMVLVSSAVPARNVEVQAARAMGIPVFRRAEFLGAMMDGYLGVAIAGTHGKTTTTAMVASILWEAGLDPTFIVGGMVSGMGTNARAGAGPHFVIEADEYDRTFHGLKPQVAVVTNVEHDHPDCYATFADFKAAFRQFLANVPPDGVLVICWDHPAARELGEQRAAQGWPVITYGLEAGADWQAVDVRPNNAGGSDFLAIRHGHVLGLVRLRVPGRHNVANALAALAVAEHLGVPFPTARSAMTSFRGVGRRFEIKGKVDGVTVVDDYAHHPTEIRATLAAVREQFSNQPVWAVWQPHTYSRTRTLRLEFALAFDRADHVLVLPIYPARERDTLGISSADVVAEMRHPDARVVESLEEAVVVLATEVRFGEVVVTLSAGDGDRVGEWLLFALSEEDEDGDVAG